MLPSPDTDVVGDPTLLIVRRNYDTETGRHIDSRDEPLRLAWEVKIAPPRGGRQRARDVIMWMDAQTGELLGGIGLRGPPTGGAQPGPLAREKPNPRQQRNATRLRVVAGAGGVIVLVLAMLYWPRRRQHQAEVGGSEGDTESVEEECERP
jgi:hypothetical protein